jgi:hypothetical protein
MNDLEKAQLEEEIKQANFVLSCEEQKHGGATSFAGYLRGRIDALNWVKNNLEFYAKPMEAKTE